MTSIEPKRLVNRSKDEKTLRSYLMSKGISAESELNATLNAIIQGEESDDWFVNRETRRKGIQLPRRRTFFAKMGLAYGAEGGNNLWILCIFKFRENWRSIWRLLAKKKEKWFGLTIY